MASFYSENGVLGSRGAAHRSCDGFVVLSAVSGHGALPAWRVHVPDRGASQWTYCPFAEALERPHGRHDRSDGDNDCPRLFEAARGADRVLHLFMRSKSSLETPVHVALRRDVGRCSCRLRSCASPCRNTRSSGPAATQKVARRADVRCWRPSIRPYGSTCLSSCRGTIVTAATFDIPVIDGV